MTPPAESSPASSRRRVLLGHLVSNGDCLYATAVARQIKADDPACHLTWAISAACRSVIEGNPHVDAVWEVPFNPQNGIEAWRQFESEAKARQRTGEFDAVFFTQFSPGFLHRYDGSIRSSTFRGYPRPIAVPVSPVIRLSPLEVENVRAFADHHRLAERTEVILFECAPRSGQSFVTPAFALEVARAVIAERPGACVILSSNVPLPVESRGDGRIIDGSVLSLRENAELIKCCSLLVGCSSGISWLCTSDWARPPHTVQLHKLGAIWFNSLVQDHERWGLSTDHIIEMADCTSARVVDCLRLISTSGFGVARLTFHECMPRQYSAFVDCLRNLLWQRAYGKVFYFLMNIARSRRVPPKVFGWLLKMVGREAIQLSRTKASSVWKSVRR